jgi:predicted AAA+ superfamily ATPase
MIKALPLRIKRTLDLKKLLKSKSYILLGPRQTGKTFLIRQQLPKVKKYNLLLQEDFQKFSFDITLLRKELTAEDKLIVIDEIQKLPELLDEIQYLIEEKGIRFLLTGSSARKLKRQSTNLLAGRARIIALHPFTSKELGKLFTVERAVNFGMLPSVYLSDKPLVDLKSYVGLYVQQEISHESLVRNLTTFTRFLEVASLCNAEQIDFTSISNDTQVSRTTIHEYFQVLEDTLIGHRLPAWLATKKRKPMTTDKFYFFDWGVAKTLQGIKEVPPKSEIYGKAIESLVFQELKAYCDYNDIDELHYWRSYQKDEVDFILNNKVAIEVKSGVVFRKDWISSIQNLYNEKLLNKYFIVYLGKTLNLEEYSWLQVINIEEFFAKLWSGNVLA